MANDGNTYFTLRTKRPTQQRRNPTKLRDTVVWGCGKFDARKRDVTSATTRSRKRPLCRPKCRKDKPSITQKAAPMGAAF
jgi:hypothetical protein